MGKSAIPDILKVLCNILFGIGIFLALEISANTLAHLYWPDYSLASPSHSYTLIMLLSRLGVGIFITAFSSWIATRVGRSIKNVPMNIGLALLLCSIILHVYEWSHYPPWYHIAWLGSIMPSAILGGRLGAYSARAR